MKPIRTWIALSVTAVLAGCSSPVDELASRAKLELSMEKSDAQGMSIEEVIAKSKEDGAAPDAVHLIRAKVGSGKGDTFEAKSSEFLVSEIPKGEHASDANHDPENCPFCRAREAKAPTVVVRLVGKDGNPFSSSAEKLLSLKRGQHLMLQGKVKLDEELNYVNIEANGLRLID
jgi:hypothetical protein